MPLRLLIHKLRTEKGLSLRELARRAGVAYQTVADVERQRETGYSYASDNLLRKLAAALADKPEDVPKMTERLLYEKYRDHFVSKVPELLPYLSMQGMETSEHLAWFESMPEVFIKRVARDVLRRPFYKEKLKTFRQEHVEEVLEGKRILSRESVVELAVALGQPVNEYLDLAGYRRLTRDQLLNVLSDRGLLDLTDPEFLRNLEKMMTQGNVDDLSKKYNALFRKIKRLSARDVKVLLAVIRSLESQEK